MYLEELLYRSYAYNRGISPDITAERWRLVFGEQAADAMEARYQMERADEEAEGVERQCIEQAWPYK